MFLNTLKTAGAGVLLAGLTIAGVVSGQSESEPAVTYVDLQLKANQKLKEAVDAEVPSARRNTNES